MGTFGDINIEADTNVGNGQIDLCKFQFTGPTGTYAGSITVYLSAVLSAPNNKVVVGIHNVGDGSKVANSAEKRDAAVGWNTLELIGQDASVHRATYPFSLINNNSYWLVWHGPNGTNGRMAAGAIVGQHGWKTRTYDGTLPDQITPEGTEQTQCSIYCTYATYTPEKFRGWKDWWHSDKLAQAVKRESIFPKLIPKDRFPKWKPRKIDTPLLALKI